jgi:hypothetical protein
MNFPQGNRDEFARDSLLQRTVRVSGDIPLLRRKTGLFPRVCGGGAGARSGETAWRGHIAPTGGNISVGPNSSTAAWIGRWLNLNLIEASGKRQANHGTLIAPGKR